MLKLLPGYTGEVLFELPNHYLKLTAEENLRFFASFLISSFL